MKMIFRDKTLHLNQKTLHTREDIQKKKKKQSQNVFAFVGKTSNIYEMPEQQHKILLHENVVKTYEKVPPNLE